MKMNSEIYLYGVVGREIRALDVIRQLKALERSGEQEVDIRISSPGGGVREGFAIYNHLKNSSLKINTYNDSQAASITAYIYLAGDKRYAAENSEYMIHKPLFGELRGVNADDLDELKKDLDRIEESILKDTSEATGLSADEIKEYLSGEGTIFTAQEAMEKGFVHEIIKPLKAVAFYDKEEPLSFDDGLFNSGNTGELEAKEMADTKTPELPVIDKAYLEANHADMLKEISDKAYAEGYEKGVTDECERIKSVEELAMAGYEDVIMSCKYDDKKTSAEAAIMLVKAQKEKGSVHMEALKSDAKESDEIPEGAVASVAKKTPEQKWEADADLRAEFGNDKGAYMAFEKANAEGRVKIIGGSK